jgi:uncharacterized protein YkwD
MSGAADSEVITLEPVDVIDIDVSTVPSVSTAPAAGEIIDLSFLGSGRDLRAAESEIVRRTNDLRRQHNLPPLLRNAQLDRAALGHTLEMVEYDFLSHVGRHSGSHLKQRAQQAGYSQGVLLGENLARGQRTAEEAIEAWLSSPGHRANLLHPNFRDIGVACLEGRVTGPDGQTYSAVYWTQNFGAPSLSPVLLTAAARQAAALLHAAGRQMERLAGERPPADHQPAPAASSIADDIEWLDE